jgi:hypothetical protein
MAHEINLLQDVPGTAAPGLSLGVVALAPLLTGALILGASWLLGFEASRLAQRVAQLEAVPRSAPAVSAPGDLAVVEHELAVRRTTLELLRGAGASDRKGFADDFHGLSRQATEGLWLTGVRLDREATTVRGRALSPERISVYLAGLRNEPLFAGHAFDTIDLHAPQEAGGAKDAPAGPSGLEFTLAARSLLVAGAAAMSREAP